MAGSKTEKATNKRKRDERKKGNVFQSKDIVSAFSLLIMFSSLKMLSGYMYGYIGILIERYIGKTSEITLLSIADAAQIMRDFVISTAVLCGPLLLISVLVTVVFSVAQTRLLFAPEALKFKFSRMNPLEGFKKLFSIRSLVELAKALAKIALVMIILYSELMDRIQEIPSLYEVDLMQGILYIGDSVVSLVFTIAILFLGVSALDYVYQWWDYEKQLKMSKQEVKEEYKQLEGDPKIKAKIKEKQRQMSQMRMMQQVPSADVVIRNPTHYAVAIRYTPGSHNAPIVVA
ncbi:MAG: EscU/YscU/HrcU family type III secretion system export apparatus switch protein, partial [Acetanaerobacterium sp.]